MKIAYESALEKLKLTAATVGMAVEAIHAVIDVATSAPMLLISLCLCMTVRALEHAVVVRVRMARGANSIRAPVIQGKVGVIESGVKPTARRMARGTRSRKARTHVIRIGRTGVILLMTPVAIGRQSRVVVVYVAACTRN